MSLKNLFASMKNEGIVIPCIDDYLMESSNEASEMHSHNYISPSSIYACVRSQIYRMQGKKKDGGNSPRLQRIYDTGHALHGMLQGYLANAGMLLIDEAPIFSDTHKIMGHTDGILQISPLALGILEIKSINSDGFRKLIEAKQEHVQQANAYMLCLEELRQEVNTANTRLQFANKRKKMLKVYADFLGTFVKGGSKFTKEQKIQHKVNIMSRVINLLYGFQKPVDTIVFLYINKDTQDLKEYIVKWDDSVVTDIKARCTMINKIKEGKKIPARPEEATGKSCQYCKYCDYKIICFK